MPLMLCSRHCFREGRESIGRLKIHGKFAAGVVPLHLVMCVLMWTPYFIQRLALGYASGSECC